MEELESKIENAIEYILEKADARGWENAEYYAEQKYGGDIAKIAMGKIWNENYSQYTKRTKV